MKPAPRPRVLLVEDDPVSAAFLEAAVSALPAQVDVAGTAADALRMAAGGHALWLVDANLPDGSGTELLAALRERDADTPALAHTADASIDTARALQAAGFAAVITKPVAAQALRDQLRAMLGEDQADAWTEHAHGDDVTALPLWDDAQALRALGGNPDHVRSLRQLFLQELEGQRRTVLAGDAQAARDELHRMAASCAFVGAARLLAAVEALRRTQDDAPSLAAFDEAARSTLQQGDSGN